MRNLPEIREWMVDNREILFDQHVAFVQSLARQSRVHYYAVYKGEQLCASLNIKETAVGICERGVFASPLIQGSGLSARIEAQFYSMLKGRGYKAVTAKVKHENARSIRYHEKLGYKETNRDNEFIYYQLDL